MNPAPNLTAAALIPQTKGWISVFGTPPNLGYPNRLAEEYAMLDVMSGGRLRVAFPLGTGMEYWANAVNPATARARFRESLDVILHCWTDDRTPELQRRLLHVPLPQPVAQADAEALSRVLHRGHRLARDHRAGRPSSDSGTRRFHPHPVQLQVFRLLPRASRPPRPPRVTPDKVTIGVFAYVAESDERAEEEFLPHLMYFFEDALRTTRRGTSTRPATSRARVPQADPSRRRARDGELGTNLVAINRIVAGTPEKVADAMGGWIEAGRQQPRQPQPGAG
jgi:alkanesulfonate monooxygenase SsuD/methylene tetrahydromethanopterin reductase-like flavin-dependent oxidoreductase (luciferase family)